MNILFRTDSSKIIGSGHLQRSITLSKNFSDIGHKCYFLCSSFRGNLNRLIKKKKFIKIINHKTRIKKKFQYLTNKELLNDAQYTINFGKKINAKFIILDSYIFNFKWQSIVSKFFNLVFIDDLNVKNNCKIYLNYHLDKKKLVKKNFLNKSTVKFIGMKNFRGTYQ